MSYNKEVGERIKKSPIALLVVTLLGLVFIACEPDNNTLGVDLFPTDDNIVVFTDTITEFETMLVRSRPRVTSNNARPPVKAAGFFYWEAWLIR